jgi:hypothetical protein
MSDFLAEYYDALDRLVKGKPTVVPKSAKINNDNVALEGGRKKGSIKKSRPVYEDLIAAIKAANEKAGEKTDQDKVKYLKAKEERHKYKALWEESLAREISLIHENAELKAQLRKIGKQPVKLPF